MTQLITFSTFNLAFVYLATCAAVPALRERKRIASERTYLERFTGPILPVVGIILCALLIYACGVSTIALGVLSILVGIPVYVLYAPRTELATIKKDFHSTEAALSRRHTRREFS